MKIVLDSGFLMNIQEVPHLTGELYSPSSVISEIRSKQAVYILDILRERVQLHIHDPKKANLIKIEKLCQKEGQIGLSIQDKEVLALAIELMEFDEIRIATDDYAIKNIAHVLNIETISIKTEGGKQRRKYYFKCKACNHVYDYALDLCDSCGYNKFTKFWKVIK